MTIQVTTPAGKAVSISVSGDSTLQMHANAIIDGRNIRLSVHAGGIVYPLDRPQQGATKYLRSQDGKTGILLSDDQAAIVGQGWEAAVTEIAATPAEVARRLGDKRENLVARIQGELDETAAARERAFTRDIGQIPDYDRPKYRVAVAALAAFDAAHPEIVAAIKREHDESVARHMWD